ncbi:PEP-CTERM sorting domain-containing protein [Paraglaciecola aquimarina]|uniref:PEP-CTERM sorting domain-containing protein n=1 Tax=Paraglaciecola aquimarina TaxID=1235557 RepID=A0ABU3SWJ2_9ALTE|nr:PEP-CTERM sorting domain-containing protein [Paraglaciecola aquimarina]MDU0354365.1 PEP-CTERM sorting domain-containing protein [Paraglaciecola aquimarina]
MSATIHSSFAEDGLNDVDGSLFDIFDVVNGSIQLASLTFSADAVGTDTISLFGDASAFNGLLFWDFTLDTNIDTSFDIKIVDTVKDVPAPATLSLLAIGLLSLVRVRKQS